MLSKQWKTNKNKLKKNENSKLHVNSLIIKNIIII